MSDKWTLDSMPDQTGKVVIITGATNGLGYEMAKAFTIKNATTILGVRDMKLGTERVEEFKKLNPQAKLDLIHLDLGDLGSVRTFADTFKSRYDRLDILMINAGIMAVPYGKTKDGFERHIGVNYLGHFALTGLLLDVIKKTLGFRIVPSSSSGESMGNIETLLKDFDQEEHYARWTSYGHSKLAQLMFVYEIDRRFREHDYDAKGIGAHPGFARTNLRWSQIPNERNLFHKYLNLFFELISQSQEKGALPLLRAATDPDAKGGEYYGTGIIQMWGYPAKNKSSKQSHDEQLARKLWEKSEELTGVHFDF